MNNYKPYSYLYKHIDEPTWLKSCFVVMVPEGKKLTLRSGDPYKDVDKIFIRYSIENDPNQRNRRQEEYNHQIDWNGKPCEVEIVVGSGSGDGGGKVVTNTEDAELL